MKQRRNHVLAALILSSLALGSGCALIQEDEEDPQLQQMSASVEAFDFYFQSTTVILEPEVEATVTLVNNGSALHSFTVPDFDAEVEAQGAETASVTFVTPDTPGPYEFFCKYHPDEMRGTVNVGAGDTDPDPVETVPDDTETETDVDY